MSDHVKNLSKRVLFAVGGTGGHLFPAQATGRRLQEKGVELLFAGANLSSNPYLSKDRFAFCDIPSATPFSGGLKGMLTAAGPLVRGISKAHKLLGRYEPRLVVGFGSFHSFPVLAAAAMRRLPIIICEPNVHPGRVNRLFSRWATLTAVQFHETTPLIKGKVVEVALPLFSSLGRDVSREEARRVFGLDPSRMTLLIFGGSQGARTINKLALSSLEQVSNAMFQVIHLTGSREESQEARRRYAERGLQACVKEFEPEMSLALRAADVAVCRAGAATLAELVAYDLPAVLVPLPRAAEDHQRLNARYMEMRGGCISFDERAAPKELASVLQRLAAGEVNTWRSRLIEHREGTRREDLSGLLLNLLN